MAGTLLSGLTGLNGCSKVEPIRPNVLFICIDDLNDWVGCLDGNNQSLTPNIDHLAEEGMLFTNAHCSYPLCSPSRISMFTGLNPATTGTYDNFLPLREAAPHAVTLMQHLRAQGYYTMGTGKIFHMEKPDPLSFNVEFQPGFRSAAPPNRPVNGLNLHKYFDWGPVDVPDSAMHDTAVCDWAMQQLEREYDSPFFLAMGLFRPHAPLYAPTKYFDKFPKETIQLPEVIDNDLDDVPQPGRDMADSIHWYQPVKKSGEWPAAVRAYHACVAYADAQVGRILDTLDQSSHHDNTIVVLTSDHGWHLGEKERWHKETLWEEASRVPLIFKVPGLTRANTQSDAPASLLDLYPTLIDLCDAPQRPEIEGRSLLPQLKDPAAKRSEPALITNGEGNYALRDSQWRYVRYADGTEELYDHQTDPNEWTNLADSPDHAATKTRLAQWLPAH